MEGGKPEIPTIKILQKDPNDQPAGIKRKNPIQVVAKPKPSELCLSFDTLLKDSTQLHPSLLHQKQRQPNKQSSISNGVTFHNGPDHFPALAAPNVIPTDQQNTTVPRHHKSFYRPGTSNNRVVGHNQIPTKKELQNHNHLKKKNENQISKQTPQFCAHHNNHSAQRKASHDRSNETQDTVSLFAKMPVGKGRQKLKSSMKKLTALKKHILLQRLQRWNESQVGQKPLLESDCYKDNDTLVLQLLNYITDDESIQDEDEYAECVSNLMELATKIGRVKDSLIPRSKCCEKGVFVLFHDSNDALAAQACWNKLVLSGLQLDVSLISKEALIRKGRELSKGNTDEEFDEMDWKQSVLLLDEQYIAALALPTHGLNTVKSSSSEQSSEFILLLDNILSQEDFDDEDCLAESLSDIVELVEKYGPVLHEKTHVERSGIYQGRIQLVFQAENHQARLVVQGMNGLILGGKKVSASLLVDPTSQSLENVALQASTLILLDIIGDDEYEDEECLEETTRDIKTLVEAFGTVQSLHVKVNGADKGQVHVSYLEGDAAVNSAVRGLHSKILGGRTIKATCRFINEESKLRPIMSGDKVIPEKYAECKRVPKIPFGDTRDYAIYRNDDSTENLLKEMLMELMKLQIRSQDDKNAKSRRRLVMGFREVARGLRAHNVKMVILAHNCDQYDAVDDKLQNILQLTKEQEIPVFFELSKKNIGKALGKSIKVSVVGIHNADGAHAQFKSLKKIADTSLITLGKK